MTRLARLAAAFALAVCTTYPDSVAPSYVSPQGYQTWSCPQLHEEDSRLNSEVEKISDLQRQNANADTALVTGGAILFFPALIGLAATHDRKDELAKDKGQLEAVEEETRAKSCPVSPPPMPVAVQSPATPVLPTEAPVSLK